MHGGPRPPRLHIPLMRALFEPPRHFRHPMDGPFARKAYSYFMAYVESYGDPVPPYGHTVPPYDLFLDREFRSADAMYAVLPDPEYDEWLRRVGY